MLINPTFEEVGLIVENSFDLPELFLWDLVFVVSKICYIFVFSFKKKNSGIFFQFQ